MQKPEHIQTRQDKRGQTVKLVATRLGSQTYSRGLAEQEIPSVYTAFEIQSGAPKCHDSQLVNRQRNETIKETLTETERKQLIQETQNKNEAASNNKI